MIGAVADLFVERVPRAAVRPVLAATSRVLVVDACSRQHRVSELVRIVETFAPLAITFVRFEDLDDVSRSTEFDRVWLFVDGTSEVAYCRLAVRELTAGRPGAKAAIISVGPVGGLSCAIELAPSRVGQAPPWRRSRELERGARELVGCLLGKDAVRG
ncbi:MAG: hypothetical protein ACSLFF_09025 [Solirubrobacterales bacterium]